MGTTKRMQNANTPNRINPVPLPLRHPRRANRLTPGSMASARNIETNNSNTKLDN
jgi:hypothetical protein